MRLKSFAAAGTVGLLAIIGAVQAAYNSGLGWLADLCRVHGMDEVTYNHG